MPSKKSEAPAPAMTDYLVIIDGHDHHIAASDAADLQKKIDAIRASVVPSTSANGK